MMNWIIKDDKIPKVINIPLNAPKDPEVHIGKIYFTINGTIAVNNPEHIPWKDLEI